MGVSGHTNGFCTAFTRNLHRTQKIRCAAEGMIVAATTAGQKFGGGVTVGLLGWLMHLAGSKTLSDNPDEIRVSLSDSHIFAIRAQLDAAVKEFDPDIMLHCGDLVEGTGAQAEGDSSGDRRGGQEPVQRHFRKHLLPEHGITRGMFVTVLGRLSEVNTADYARSFAGFESRKKKTV